MEHTHQTTTRPKKQPLDDCSPEAVALVAFACRHRIPRWIPLGSASAGYVEELAEAGIVTITRDDDRDVEIYRVEWPWERRAAA
jgi:hypothetical protein